MAPRKPQPGRDLASLRPDLAKEANGWDPSTVSAMSNEKLNWICALGHEWNAKVAHRSNGSNCPIHAGTQVLAGYNDLATTNPDLAKQAHGWDPTTVTFGSGKKLEWMCEKDEDNPHTWSVTVGHRSRGRGCPSCAEYGFNPAKPGWLYLMKHVEHDYLQIGISNVIKDRLKHHRRYGWTEVEDIGPWELGENARQWETALLKSLKKQGAEILKDIGIKVDGVTINEAWTRKSFPAASLKDIVSLVPAKERAKLVEPDESWLRDSSPVRSLSELRSLVDDEDWADLDKSA